MRKKMKKLNMFSFYFLFMLSLFFSHFLYGQIIKSPTEIQGNWKISEMKLLFSDRVNIDSLTEHERYSENGFKKELIGNIVSITKDNFYLYKNGQIDDTMSYVINNDSIVFEATKEKWIFKNIIGHIVEKQKKELIIEFFTRDIPNIILRTTFKKLKK